MEELNKIQGFKINSAGYGTIPKLVMQDRNLHAMAKALYAYFCSYTGAGNTCFPSRSKICYDLGISIDTFTKYLRDLVSYGFVEVKQVKDNGKFSYNLYTLLDTVVPCPKISDTGNPSCRESTVSEISVYGKTDTNNNSIKKNSTVKNNNIKKESKKERKEPEKQRKENIISFNQLIEDYTPNEQLRSELKEHLKVRKNKKAALTNRAIELSLKKLDDLAANDSEKIQMVQNAIMSGWTTFYPLKADEKKKMGSKPSYNINSYERQSHNIFDELYEESKSKKDFIDCEVNGYE